MKVNSLVLGVTLLAASSSPVDASIGRRYVRGQLHQRPARTPQSAAESAATPAPTNRIIADVTDIFDQLASLPSDVLSYFKEIADGIADVKGLLSNVVQLLGGEATTEITPGETLMTELPSLESLVPPITLSTQFGNTTTRKPRVLPIWINATRPPPVEVTTTIRSTVVEENILTVFVTTIPSSSNQGETSTTEAPGIPSTTVSASQNPSPTFDPEGFDNVAVYYQFSTNSTNTTHDGLMRLCEDPAINIVNLGFVNYNANPYTDTWTASIDCRNGRCSGLVAPAQRCQALGKKVFLSIIPEWTADTDLHNIDLHVIDRRRQNAPTSSISRRPVPSSMPVAESQMATELADFLWSNYGGGKIQGQYNNFSSLVFDGFDFFAPSSATTSFLSYAIAAWSAEFFVDVVEALRQRFAGDTSKAYFLSAAPHCAGMGSPIGLAALQLVDFVNVQYFNDPYCSFDNPAFDIARSLTGWSNNLEAKHGDGSPMSVSTTATSHATTATPCAKLFLGAAAPLSALATDVNATEIARWSNLSSFFNPARVPLQGGIMLWGPPEDVELAGVSGTTFVQYAKGQIGCLDGDGNVVDCYELGP